MTVTRAFILGQAASEGAIIDRGSGITQYSTFANLPSVGNTAGDMAFVQASKALYVWDGTEWGRVYNGPDEILYWTTEPETSYILALDGSSTTITTTAVDPEGFPIFYSYDTNPPNQSQATILNNSDGSFTLTPSTDSSNEGEFSLRIKANDGLHVSSKMSNISLFWADLISLSGGTGGGPGTTSYTAPNGTVVSVSNIVYGNPAYNIGFMFNNTKTAVAGNYFLSDGGVTGHITFNFTNSNVNLIKEARVWPYCRSDTFSNITSIQTSSDGTSWTTLYGDQGLNIANTPVGKSYTYFLEYTSDKYLRFNLARSGSWGLSMNEIEIYGTTTL